MNQDKIISIKCEGKESFDIDDLLPLQGKLKSSSKEMFNKLKQSLIKDGLPLGFHVWKDSKDKVYICDGHHRQLALKALRDDGYFIPPVPCNVVSAKNKKEAAKVVLISNSKYAEMSQESLSDFMIDFEMKLDDLEFLDLPDFELSDLGLENNELSKDELNEYSTKISTPIYEAKEENPPDIKELFNIEKYNELIKNIKDKGLSKEVEQFLIYAASRHIVFNYENIAEFYCHQNKEIQELMEDSALVIIDFNKAIENGFVKLTQELEETYNSQETEE